MKILTERKLSGYTNIRFINIRHKLTSKQGELISSD